MRAWTVTGVRPRKTRGDDDWNFIVLFLVDRGKAYQGDSVLEWLKGL